MNHLAGWDAWWPSPSVPYTDTHAHIYEHTRCTPTPYTSWWSCTHVPGSHKNICIHWLITAWPYIASTLQEAYLTAVQIYLAVLQAICSWQCFGECVYLAEFWAKFSEQMVLQQVITTQDKLLNWLCLCGRETEYHYYKERERERHGDSTSLSWVWVVWQINFTKLKEKW